MKKKRGLGRAVIPLSRQDLEEMPTGALLARLRRLQRCEEARAYSDLSDEDVASASHLILFKSDASWRLAHVELKTVLAEREHVVDRP
jgi:hypothetical protein